MIIGKHIHLRHPLNKTVEYAHDLHCQIFQIFTSNPQSLAVPSLEMKKWQVMREALEKYDMHMVIHGKYNINLCQETDSYQGAKNIQSLWGDMNIDNILGERCLGVIIHMGKNVPALNFTTDEALQMYIDNLKHALAQVPDSIIILETGASQGTEVGSQLPDLARIYHGLNASEQARIRFCVDTCHIWATGYDISTRKGVRAFFREFDTLIDKHKIACIHLNDSVKGLGSKVDRHADLNDGTIGAVGLTAVIRYANRHTIPLIMETPYRKINQATGLPIHFADELKLIQSWLHEK